MKIKKSFLSFIFAFLIFQLSAMDVDIETGGIGGACLACITLQEALTTLDSFTENLNNDECKNLAGKILNKFLVQDFDPTSMVKSCFFLIDSSIAYKLAMLGIRCGVFENIVRAKQFLENFLKKVLKEYEDEILICIVCGFSEY